jgi:RHS repeat-associated protein
VELKVQSAVYIGSPIQVRGMDAGMGGLNTPIMTAVVNPFRFAGQTGGYRVLANSILMHARIFRATYGRWPSRDELGLLAGWNWYAYVENNPITWVDPAGLALWVPEGKTSMKLKTPDSCTHNRVVCEPEACLTQLLEECLKKYSQESCGAAAQCAAGAGNCPGCDECDNPNETADCQKCCDKVVSCFSS